MKKLLVSLCVAGLMVSSSSLLFAGGADNKTSWSVEYIRTLNRNAATDSADIVMYNPAGIMKMADGFYGNVSAQYVAKDYNNKINGVDFDQDEPSIIPGLFAIYKKDRVAGYLGVSNVVGGGKVEFDDGLLTTHQIGWIVADNFNAGLNGLTGTNLFNFTQITDQKLEGDQYGLGYTFGGAYQINDMFSVALALRYVDTEIEMKGSATLVAPNSLSSPPAPAPGLNDPIAAKAKFEEDADGWGYLLGVNITPSDQLNIGIRYESKVDLDFDQEVKQDEISGNLPNFVYGGTVYDSILPIFGRTDGGERERNLPAIFAIGASYQLNPKIRLETNFTYYLNEDAGFDDIPGTLRDESDVDNGFDLGIAIEYAFSETLKGSLGYLYTETGVDAEDMTPWLPELDAHSLGAGVAWKVMPNLDLNFGICQVFYQDDDFVYSYIDYSGATIQHQIEYEKDITILAFGIQYKFI
jgi:long-chain fatty acid transport protein